MKRQVTTLNLQLRFFLFINFITQVFEIWRSRLWISTYHQIIVGQLMSGKVIVRAWSSKAKRLWRSRPWQGVLRKDALLQHRPIFGKSLKTFSNCQKHFHLLPAKSYLYSFSELEKFTQDRARQWISFFPPPKQSPGIWNRYSDKHNHKKLNPFHLAKVLTVHSFFKNIIHKNIKAQNRWNSRIM